MLHERPTKRHALRSGKAKFRRHLTVKKACASPYFHGVFLVMKPPDVLPEHSAPDSIHPPSWRRFLPISFDYTNGRRTLRARWVWGTLLAALLPAGVYLVLAASVFLFAKYGRGVVGVSFLDLAWPSRWGHYRTATGNHLIGVAGQQLAVGDARAALVGLQAGVSKSPGNRTGRLLLHELLRKAGRLDLAKKVLLDGLPFLLSDPAYLQAVFGFLLQQQDDDAVRRIGAGLLSSGHLSAEAADVTTLACASACYFRGRYDQAEDFLLSRLLDRTHDGRLLLAQIDWDRGYRDLALLNVRALTEDFPASEAGLAQFGAWLRETDARDEYRRLCLLRRFATPDAAAPRIALLHALREAGDASALAAETEALLQDFAHDEAALAALGEFAAHAGDPALARRAHDLCRSRGLTGEATAFLLIEASIAARDHRAALAIADELLETHPDWAERHGLLFDSLRAVALFGLHDDATARLHLKRFLSRPGLRAEPLLVIARQLAAVGARPEARQTLAHALAADPLNQAAAAQLVVLDLELGLSDALPADLHRLAGMRKPSPGVLCAAVARLGSDRFLFTPGRDSALHAAHTALAAAPRAPRN